jgi:hypothetical protein
VALLLWLAAASSGQITFLQATTALASGVLLWGLYFTLGFQAFTRGTQANLRGLSLTLGLPALAFLLQQLGCPFLAGLLPPGAVHHAATTTAPLSWCLGAVCTALVMLVVTRLSLAGCEIDLRHWYENHHGKMVLE